MKVEVSEDQKEVIIRMPLQKPAHKKDNAKLDIVVSSGGWQHTGLTLGGKPFKLNVIGGIPIG